jgi:hypothetical protein
MWIMSRADLIASYRRYAASCLEIALRTTDENNRASLLNMAQAWLILADHAEKTAAHGVAIVIADPEQRPFPAVA